MHHAQLRKQILDLAHRELGPDTALPEGDLAESLDSMQRLALAVAIEDHFQVCLEPDDERGLRTVDDVVRLLAARLEADGGA